MITGDSKEGSIGEAIRVNLETFGMDVQSFKGDIRYDINSFDNIPKCLQHALILCHGVSHLDWIEDIPIDKLHEIVAVNVTGTAHLVRSWVNTTMYHPWRKRIIIIGSMAHRQVLNGSAVYCASKAALAMLSRCLAWELAPKGFDVFCIHPSNVANTPMSFETIEGLERYRGMSHMQAHSYWSDSEIRPLLTTFDIVEMVNFLLSKHAAYLSGCQLELAGGQR